MHELGLAKELLAEALAIAEREGASEVNELRIALGGDAHAGTADALGQALRLLAAETIARKANVRVSVTGRGSAAVLESIDVS